MMKMKLCPVDERISCSQCAPEDQLVKITKMAQGETLQIFSESNQMIFVLQGSLSLFCKKVNNKKIKTEELILIPLQRPYVITALEDVSMLVIKLDHNIALCERMPLGSLFEKHEKNGKKGEEVNIGLLKPHSELTKFANAIKDSMSKKLNCSYFFELKIREFLFFMRVYYDTKQIYNFFKPVYNKDFHFSSMVYKHLDSVKTIKEMAVKLDYSLSGFEKKFKRIFNLPPYHWMQEQKAKKVFHEVTCTKKTFTEIAFEYGFSSPAHFNDYCKQYFDGTPGEVRKKNVNQIHS